MDHTASNWYQLEDFHKIPVLQLRVGDELLLDVFDGDWLGALPVISVTFPEGDWMVYSYSLPVGINISSNDERTVHVTWQGQKPCIRVDAWMPITQSLYILRK